MRAATPVSVLVLSLAVLILAAPSGRAAWPLEGRLLCGADVSQLEFSMVSDGEGGAIVLFRDLRYGEGDIFAQRVDADGNIQWGPDGVPVCTVTGDQISTVAVSDGSGGAVIAWQDLRGGSSDIYVQRIDAGGNRLWNTSGVALCTATSSQIYPKITTDGSGGAIVAWEDWRDGTRDIYARRVDGAGNVLWTIFGVQVCSQNFESQTPVIESDGTGGAYIAWEDRRSGGYDIYFDRISADGTLSWGSDGMGLCTESSGEYDPDIVNVTAGVAAFAWRDSRNGYIEVYGQLVDNISPQWYSNGNQLCAVTGVGIDEFDFSMDEDGALVISLETMDHLIRVQRVLLTGDFQWGPAGVAVSEPTFQQYAPSIVPACGGGSLVFWHDYNRIGNRLFAQHLDDDGTGLWDPDGRRIVPGYAGQWMTRVLPDPAGGALAVWREQREGDRYDLFAQTVDRNGYIAEPEPLIAGVLDVPNDQGGRIEVRWDASYLDPWPYQEITHYTVWKSLSPEAALLAAGGGERDFVELRDAGPSLSTAPGEPVIRREVLGGVSYYWELLATQDAQSYEGYSKVLDTDFDMIGTSFEYSWYQVAAHTADPLAVFTSAPDSGYSIDNLAPSMPLNLTGEQEFSPAGLALSWRANTEEDFTHYTIYRGIGETFEPSATFLIGTSTDTLHFDADWSWSAGYWYKVSAVDIHLNESESAVLGPDLVTGDDPPGVPDATFLAQNRPNPFNPSTSIDFGLKRRAHVSLRIYDAAGRLVATLVEGALPAGRHTAAWDGRGQGGRTAASGVYFYRLRTGDFERTRKMILMR